jgi:hypothetical protein
MQSRTTPEWARRLVEMDRKRGSARRHARGSLDSADEREPRVVHGSIAIGMRCSEQIIFQRRLPFEIADRATIVAFVTREIAF